MGVDDRCRVRVPGGPSLGWMDGVKVTLASRGMTVETARKIGRTGTLAHM